MTSKLLYGAFTPTIEKKLEINYLDDYELSVRYLKIKPLVMIDGITYKLRTFTDSELSNLSYLWNAEKDKREIVHKEDLEVIEDIVCLHTYGYYGFFKPSIHEVLSQLNPKSIEEADYFEIIEQPETRDDVFKYQDVLNAGYHMSVVRTYKVKGEKK